MAKVRDLVDDASREYFEALASGDPEVTADFDRAFRRNDVVATCPASKLADLAAEHPELIDEIARRRGEELRQL